MTRLKNFFSGTSLQARASRSSAITILGYGTEQALRLVSNVVLAALLYPEAFGIMAIATVVMIGLNMVSDSGIHHAIIQNKKGACLLYTSPSPRDGLLSRMPSSA